MKRTGPSASPVLLVSLAALLLAGCGGDSKKRAPPLSGVLHGGSIQGVDFSTPTQSGSTDAGGHYTYLPGETISFSVGGIALGSAQGAADITLFTLAGLTPPTTERGLRRELDLVMRTNTPFTRAMNIALLLIELDADGLPGNGLDVRNRQATLAGITLDFDLRYRAFEASLYRLVPDLTHNIPPMLPLVHLYGSLGIKVPVHAQTRVDYDSQFGLWNTAFIYGYHANGALATDELDIDGDGFVESHTTIEYGALLRITRVAREEDTDLDQVMDRTASTETEYSAQGKIIAGAERYVSASEGPMVYRLVEHEVDRFGRSRRQLLELDRGDDGSIDARRTLTVEYDTRGNAMSVRWLEDVNGDGTSDSISLTTYEYDARNRVLERRDDFDFDADGVVDAQDTDFYDYANGDGPAYLRRDTDDNGDGIADSRRVYRWEYDAQGNAISTEYENEPSADGTISNSASATQEYDAARRVTRAVRSEDNDANGVPELRQTDSFDFDDIGNLGEHISEFDDNGDGVVDARVTQGSEYGAGGESLASATSFDWDADGVSDNHSSETVTNTTLDDGVLHLAQWYFMRRLVTGSYDVAVTTP